MSFWKPGQSAPGLSYNSNQTGHQAKFDNFRGGADVRIASLAKYKQHFAFLVEKYQTVIVCGESLELKASYLPKYLIEYGWCGQGHRLAFVTAASREARQLHEHCQDSVASGDESFKEKIRLSVAIDDYVPKYTSLIFTTYEALLSQILLDPLLSKYSVLFLDGSSGGFDSSGFNSGLVMSILKKIMRKRVDLRVVIFTSARDAESLQSFFNVNKVSFLSKDEDPVKLADSCIVFSIESRQYPVQRLFLSEPCSDYITETIETVFKIHQYEGAGDILVFLSGREDIDTVVTLLSDRVVDNRMALLVLPLYGGIGSPEYSNAIQPAPVKTRKVIVSTNMAEQEGLIDGIVFVVDAGFVKINVFNPLTATEHLIRVPISKKNSEARSRICGFTRPGKCYHLYTAQDLESLENLAIPAIQRSNLITPVLQLKALGIENIKSFDHFHSPPSSLLVHALEILSLLGLISQDSCSITLLGKHVVECPLHDTMLATMLLKSASWGCTEEALIICSMFTVKEYFLSGPSGRYEEAKRKFAVDEGDVVSVVNVYQSFVSSRKSASWCQANFVNFNALNRAVSYRNHLAKYLQRIGIQLQSCGRDVDSLRKCIASVYFVLAAKLSPDGSYRFLRAKEQSPSLFIHWSSCLFNQSPNWIVALEARETSKTFLYGILTIDPLWLPDLAPSAFTLGF